MLIAMSKKVGDFVPYIGGPEFAHHLIPILEPLCQIEEPTVRNAAAASMSKILSLLSPSHTTSIAQFNEFFMRISNEEDGEVFYGRVSACQFFPDLYRLLSPTDKQTLREVYSKFFSDEMSMVRRGAVLSFIRFSEVVDVDVLSTEFIQLMK